jgi:hypothetical protein
MILFLSIKHTVNNVIIRYIVYDDICLMVRKINYFIFLFYFLTLDEMEQDLTSMQALQSAAVWAHSQHRLSMELDEISFIWAPVQL